MTWKEEYQGGTLGGAPFITRISELELGREVHVHEYPKRDDHYPEDMGKKTRQYTLRCFVIGDDYRDKRDRLLDVIEKEGPHTLTHPYFGSMRIAVTTCRVAESTEQGGMARFTINFVNAGVNQYPSTRIDTQSRIEQKSNDAINVVKEVFNQNFTVSKLPAAVATHSTGVVSVLTDSLNDITGKFPSAPDELSGYVSDLNVLSNTSSTLIRTPGNLANSVVGTLSRVRTLFQRPLDAFNVYRSYFSFGDSVPTVASGGVVSTVQANNRSALVSLIEHSALVEAVRTSSTIEFDNYTQAASLREELDTRLDNVMLIADDDSFTALNDLRVAMIQDITERGANLARISHFTPQATLPALVIAHRLYQDAARADEIIERNAIVNPGFVQGGQELEVLT